MKTPFVFGRVVSEQSSQNLVVNIDLYSCRTEDIFYKEFAKTVNAATNTSFGIDVMDKKMDFSEILDIPLKVAQEKGKKNIIWPTLKVGKRTLF